MRRPSSRFLHKTTGILIAVPLIFMVFTGLSYRLGRTWFGMEKSIGSEILHMHSGAWLGSMGSALFVTTLALGILLLVAAGVRQKISGAYGLSPRVLHRVIGWAIMLPLLATALTGMLYRLGELYFPFSESTEELLMSIHEGAWLGRELRPFYVLLLGAGVVWMIGSGISIGRYFRKRGASNPSSH